MPPMPSLPPTLCPAALDRRQGTAATSAGRGWPCRLGEGAAMPSVPLTLGLAVPDRTEGGRLPRRRGGDVPVVWGSGRPGPAGRGGVWMSMPSVPPTLGLAVLDCREGAAVTSAGRG